MNRAMIATTSRLIVLADHTKWGVVGLCAMARLADASVLVSDEGLSAEARDALSTAVGELILAGPGTGIGLPSPVRLRDVVVAGWALQFRHFEFQRAVMPGSRSIPCAMEPRGVRGASNIRLILLGCQVIK
jgi:hypothetical protein